MKIKGKNLVQALTIGWPTTNIDLNHQQIYCDFCVHSSHLSEFHTWVHYQLYIVTRVTITNHNTPVSKVTGHDPDMLGGSPALTEIAAILPRFCWQIPKLC